MLQGLIARQTRNKNERLISFDCLVVGRICETGRADNVVHHSTPAGGKYHFEIGEIGLREVRSPYCRSSESLRLQFPEHFLCDLLPPLASDLRRVARDGSRPQIIDEQSASVPTGGNGGECGDTSRTSQFRRFFGPKKAKIGRLA